MREALETDEQSSIHNRASDPHMGPADLRRISTSDFETNLALTKLIQPVRVNRTTMDAKGPTPQ